MSSIDNLAKDLYTIIHNKEEKGPKPYEPVAKVVKVDADTIWVKIPGGETETPVEKTIDAEIGDRVRVRVSGGRAWILGNATSPPASSEATVRYIQDGLEYNPSFAEIFSNSIVQNSTIVNSAVENAIVQNSEIVESRIYNSDIENFTVINGVVQGLEATDAIIQGHLEAHDAEFESLDTNYAHITNGVIDNATIGYADVNGLSANYASISDLTVATGRIDNLEANEVVINDTLTATNAHVEYLESDWISTDRLVLTGNNKNNYPPVEITESEFNVNKTAYYTKNGDTYTQCTSSSVYNPETQYYVRQTVKSIIEAINTANNTDPQIIVSNDKLIAASIDVAELSAITADMGTLTAGKIQKGNNYINLNTSPASMEFKNASTWSGATQGIKFDTQGNLAIKGTVDITSSNTIYNKSQIDTALADKADADDVYSKSDFSITPSQIISKVTATEVKLAGMYATCSTNAGTTNKVAIISPNVEGWSLYTGATVTVKFSNANTVASPNLCVKGKSTDTGSNIAIKTFNGGTLAETDYKWSAGDTLTFIYNGTNWLMQEASARLKTAETSITQSATSIESLASNQSTYTKPDGTTGTNAIKSAITQTANSIESVVANNATYTAPDGTTKTNTIQSAIKQNADNILLRVEKSGVIAAINASVEEQGGSAVKISADKVNIEGAAIFTGSGRLSTTSLDHAYDANGAATGAVSALTTDLASASGITVINGGHIDTGSITIGQVNGLQTSIDDAAWTLLVSISSINYATNTATLTATVYKYGEVQSSGFTLQWYKNGTAISGQRSATLSNVTADALYTCVAS